LIPECDSASGREWRGYARTFFSAVARQLCDDQERNATELYRLLTAASPEELRILLGGTPARAFLGEANERMFGSIHSVASASVAALEYVIAQKADPFSVRRWVRESRRGVVFLPYDARQISALAPMISAWLRLAIFEAMNPAKAQPGADQRLWFVVDELDAPGPIDGLKDALARLRKFGGRCVLGFQSIAQVSTTYGAGEAQTIVENCGNTSILRSSASEHGGTARFASRLIGQREVVRRQTSTNRSTIGFTGPARRSKTTSDQHVTEDAVMASEIEQLPDLAGYLKMASRATWLRIELERRFWMQMIHFTPGSLDPENVRRHGTVAHLPLANGEGKFEVSALYLAPGGQIKVPPENYYQLLLVVNGRADTLYSCGLRSEVAAGMGVLFDKREGCHVSSTTGAVILTIESDNLLADICGISSPERVRGQLWPAFESDNGA
jgi:hypothetical protein